MFTAEKYCDLLEEEGGIELLEEVYKDPRPIEEVKLLASQILNFIRNRNAVCPGVNQVNGNVNGHDDAAMDG